MTYDKTPMDHQRGIDELLRAFWLGLGGQAATLRRHLERAAEAWEAPYPSFAKRIRALLQQPAPALATRDVGDAAAGALTPSDDASHQELLQLVNAPALACEPVWPPAVHETLHLILAEHRQTEALSKKGLAPTRTMLFVGQPGQGKSLAAQWMARELKFPLATVNLSAMMSSLLGQSGSNVRKIFSFGQSRPMVLFLDELDALAKRRTDDMDVGETKRLVTVLLQEMDAWPPGSLLIAATNHAQLLDEAIWRRFEEVVEFPEPTQDQLSTLLDRLLDDADREASIDQRDILTAAFAGRSFASFTLAVQRARRTAAVYDRPLGREFVQVASDRARELNLQTKKSLARTLRKHGATEREVKAVTGLHRDTIRHATRS